MNWSELLDERLLCAETRAEDPNRPSYAQDFDRIAFSAPFRRLGNKTQVHPLYDNDHIHNRLIHSLEAANVGRSLGMMVGHALEEAGEIGAGERHRVSGIVQAACLAHDIGNPPFGHSGEEAIGAWFAERFARPEGLFADVAARERLEFEKFEGNAQGFRILARQEMYRGQGGMRLSHAVLGTFAKYPATASASAASKAGRIETYCGLKKYGLFERDVPLFAKTADRLKLPAAIHEEGRWWRRHPLVFLVEAADDICYNIVDIEDAVVSGDLDHATAAQALEAMLEKPRKPDAGQTEGEHIATLRAMAIGQAVQDCVRTFLARQDELMTGRFSSSLIECSDRADAFAAVRTLAKARIFKSRRKTELEILGRNVIRKALDGALPVYEALARAEWDARALTGYEEQLRLGLGLDLRDVTDPYTALHSLADFVSGMTDRHAVRIAGTLG